MHQLLDWTCISVFVYVCAGKNCEAGHWEKMADKDWAGCVFRDNSYRPSACMPASTNPFLFNSKQNKRSPVKQKVNHHCSSIFICFFSCCLSNRSGRQVEACSNWQWARDKVHTAHVHHKDNIERKDSLALEVTQLTSISTASLHTVSDVQHVFRIVHQHAVLQACRDSVPCSTPP